MLILIGLAAFMLGCDPVQTFTYENATDQTVVVKVDGRQFVTLAPGETRTFSSSRNKKAREVVVETMDGTVVLQKNFTWNELKDLSFHVRIE